MIGPEGPHQVDGWTIQLLKDHLETVIAASEQRLMDLIDAERHLRLARREDDVRAIDKAEQAMTKRLDAMNELRNQLNDQARTFVSMDTFKADLSKVDDALQRNREEIERVRDLSLPRETYDTTLKEWRIWRDAVDKWLLNRRGMEQGVTSLGRLFVILISVIVGLLTIVVVITDHFVK